MKDGMCSSVPVFQYQIWKRIYVDKLLIVIPEIPRVILEQNDEH